jgi:hypothetical protein
MDSKEKEQFLFRCEKDLPNTLLLDDVNFKLHARILLSGTFRISYGEFDGNFFIWENKPIDLFYKLVDEIPLEEYYKDGDLKDGTIYKKNIDDIITDCLERLNNWHKGQYKEGFSSIEEKDNMVEWKKILTKYFHNYYTDHKGTKYFHKENDNFKIIITEDNELYQLNTDHEPYGVRIDTMNKLKIRFKSFTDENLEDITDRFWDAEEE